MNNGTSTSDWNQQDESLFISIMIPVLTSAIGITFLVTFIFFVSFFYFIYTSCVEKKREMEESSSNSSEEEYELESDDEMDSFEIEFKRNNQKRSEILEEEDVKTLENIEKLIQKDAFSTPPKEKPYFNQRTPLISTPQKRTIERSIQMCRSAEKKGKLLEKQQTPLTLRKRREKKVKSEVVYDFEEEYHGKEKRKKIKEKNFKEEENKRKTLVFDNNGIFSHDLFNLDDIQMPEL